MGAVGATGEQGPAGPQGIQGPAGQVLVVDGGVLVGPPGSSVVVTPVAAGGQPCPTGGVRLTQLSDGGITNICNGEVGPTGPQGLQGQTGAQGATGAAGPQGPAGAQGATGPQGPQGQTGPAGSTGSQGPAGATGPQGVPGGSVSAVMLPSLSPSCITGGVQLTFADGGTLAVCNGATGATGATGLTGSQGPAGAQGAAGPAGDVGATGPSGPPGAQGPTGSTGPQGPAGPQGVPGPVGPALYLDGGVATLPGPRFVGFTTATYNANLGGNMGANAKCQAQFPGAQFCSITDYRAAEVDSTTTVPPGTGAWVDASRTVAGYRDSASYCSSWTSNTVNSSGYMVTLTGTGNDQCSTLHSIACCSTPTPVQFAGVTAASFNANLGGIPGANAKCRADFPGSYFCTSTDVRAAELSGLPVASAWVDSSRDDQGRRGSNYCTSWTSSTVNSSGLIFTPTGTANDLCSSTRPVACCR